MSLVKGRRFRAAIFDLGDVTFITRFHRNVKVLKYLGFDVRCFSVKPRDTSKARPFEGILVDGWTRRFRHRLFGPLRHTEIVLRFLLAIIRYKPDILFAHNVPGLLVGWVAACFLGKKNLILIYDAMELECARAPGIFPLVPFLPRGFSRLFIERMLINKADLVISADYARTEFMKVKFERDDILTCRNVPVFKEVQSTHRIQESLKLREGTFVFLYQGTIGTGRGIEQGIKCLKGLPEEIVFVIMGMSIPEYIESLKRLAADEAVSNRVYFLPPVPSDELLEWTASADVVHSIIENVCLSYYFAAPNKLYEAAMAGIPAIASSFPEMETVLKKHPYGLIVDPESLDEIQNALLKLYKDAGIREEFKKNALLAARYELNWEMESRQLCKEISVLTQKIMDKKSMSAN